MSIALAMICTVRTAYRVLFSGRARKQIKRMNSSVDAAIIRKRRIASSQKICDTFSLSFLKAATLSCPYVAIPRFPTRAKYPVMAVV